MQNTILKTLLLAMLSVTTGAFVVTPSAKATTVRMEAAKQNEFIPSHVKAAAFAALVTVSQPLMALAEDDYEYGAVDAPPLVPIIGGIACIATALLPIAMRGGEEAFEEMKDTDGFGSGRDQLKSRKR